MKNVWILTEERPKESVVQTILEKVASDQHYSLTIQHLKIIPVFEANAFTFAYRVDGVTSPGFGRIYIRLAKGDSSFVDFLLFIQEKEPAYADTPLYAIEETKTSDSESRNTGALQRCAKFVYVDFFYPGIRKIMLYNLVSPEKETQSATALFGLKMMKTMGVEVLGKTIYTSCSAFSTLKELVESKNSMRLPPASNIPIRVSLFPDHIEISGRLQKAGGMNHDPNMGALSAIASCIRQWENTKDIVITRHGLTQEQIKSNKFVRIARKLNMKIADAVLPLETTDKEYWHYDSSQEKNVTILLHVMLATYTNATVLYSNHAGAERSYFIDAVKGPIVIEKFKVGMRDIYKTGDKNAIIHLPDLVVFDSTRSQSVCVEGKKYANKKAGILDLKNYGYLEDMYIKPSWKPKSMIRTVALFGGEENSVIEPEVSFVLDKKGHIVLSDAAPAIFRDALAAALAAQNV